MLGRRYDGHQIAPQGDSLFGIHFHDPVHFHKIDTYAPMRGREVALDAGASGIGDFEPLATLTRQWKETACLLEHDACGRSSLWLTPLQLS